MVITFITAKDLNYSTVSRSINWGSVKSINF